ncbi:MAG TPA: carboxypeptidase regulatory-like domain-containing protein [Pyrinomonadaceae bacterium]
MIVLLLPASFYGQTTATIVGTVKDSAGATLPSAVITVTNTETNSVRTTNSDDEGNYSLQNLPIGKYSIGTELTGFKRSLIPDVQLVVNQTARFDIVLEVGNVNEQVTVDASAPLIESETSTVGQVIENQTIVQLPLNGRNFIRLGSLIPGTNEGAPGASVVRSRQGGVALTSNGQRAEYNNFTLDGVDNNETLFGVAVVVPSIDAIQEFKVQTANYSAEFGRGSGANVNVAIKNGTNELRGTVYEFVRNDAFDARNPFSTRKNPLRRNQFGFSVGGPIVLPKFGSGDPLVDLRDRSFFFFNYEGLIERRGFTSLVNVPSAAQRGGVFATAITDPTTGQPFPNNRIPEGRINPISQRILQLIPLPNTAGSPNYNFSSSNPTDNNQINTRIDHRFSDNHQIFGRYSQTSSEDLNRAINLNGQETNIKTRGLALSWSHVFSANSVNDLKFGFQRYEFNLFPDGYGVDGAQEFGLPSFITDPIFNRYPTILVTGQANFGGGISNPLLRGENTYQLVDGFSTTIGKHSLKIGGDLRYYQASNFQPQFPTGEYTFNGTRTGNSVADFLLGLPSQQRLLNTTGFDRSRLRNWRADLYVQDDIQVSSRLTLNLGLRWERDGDWRERDNRFAYFDPATGQLVYPEGLPDELKTILNAFRAANVNNPNAFTFRLDGGNVMRPAQNKQFAPRVGFAFRPFNDNKTVIRGAYGVFWGQPIANVYLNQAFTPPPFSLNQTVTGANQQFGVFPGVTPQTLVPVNPSFFTLVPEEFKNSYVQQWNVGIEREVGFNTAVKISYVGSRGLNLERRYDINAGQPSTTPITNARRPYRQFGSIQYQDSNAKTSYHSLQMSAERRFSQGLLFLAGYTWSKSLDDTSTWLGLGGQESQFPQNPRNLAAEYGRSGFDLRHRFTLSAVYELPFRSENKALDLLIGGFQVSGILTLRTGYPFSVIIGNTDTANITGTGTANSRLNLVGDPFANVPAGYYFNPAAFARPAAGTFGSSGRNALSGPNAQQLDLSVMKVMRFSEKYSLQLRAEAFNALNHPTLGLPINDFGNANFGRILSADNRELQFGIKFLF